MGALITGVGCVTPIGIGFEAFSDSLRNAVSGIGQLTLCDPDAFRCRIAAEVKGFDPLQFVDIREARSLPRVSLFAVAAARLAVEHAGLRPWADSTRVGVLLGTSSGPVAYALQQHATFLERGARRVHPSSPAFAQNGIVASQCAIELGIHGPVLTISSACTSSTDAIGIGQALVASNVVDVLLVGGADAPICPSVFASFERLGMMPTGFNQEPAAGARPFDIDRSGFVLGEGAAVLVLESKQHAAERGAIGLAEVLGYGASCDAGSHFQQDPEGTDAIRAVREALQSIDTRRVSYINAHGSGTRENDPFEAKILRCALGAAIEQIPVSSSKSQFGHLLGACGAVEAAVGIAAIGANFLPATLNLRNPDPRCDLRHVREIGESAKLDVVLSTNFGFGSRNAALALGRV